MAQVAISVTTNGESEDKRFEGRAAGIDHQVTTLTASGPRKMWIRSKTAATARPPRSWKPRGVPAPRIARISRPRLNPPAWISSRLEDVRVTAQVGTAHAPRVIEMRKRAFDQFAAPTHQTAAAWSTNPATIPIHRRLGLGHL